MGDRNIVILPGGPGNDMSMYDDPSMSIAQTFFQVADVFFLIQELVVKVNNAIFSFAL